jgi:hypothetical protein
MNHAVLCMTMGVVNLLTRRISYSVGRRGKYEKLTRDAINYVLLRDVRFFPLCLMRRNEISILSYLKIFLCVQSQKFISLMGKFEFLIHNNDLKSPPFRQSRIDLLGIGRLISLKKPKLHPRPHLEFHASVYALKTLICQLELICPRPSRG